MRDSGTAGSDDVWLDGEPNGRSEFGDDDNEDDSEDGRDDKGEFVGIVVIDAVIVDDLSRVLVLVVNCPRCRGCSSQCLGLLVVGASLRFYRVGHAGNTLRQGFFSRFSQYG